MLINSVLIRKLYPSTPTPPKNTYHFGSRGALEYFPDPPGLNEKRSEHESEAQWDDPRSTLQNGKLYNCLINARSEVVNIF